MSVLQKDDAVNPSLLLKDSPEIMISTGLQMPQDCDQNIAVVACVSPSYVPEFP